jgi:hypothetical protein
LLAQRYGVKIAWSSPLDSGWGNDHAFAELPKTINQIGTISCASTSTVHCRIVKSCVITQYPLPLPYSAVFPLRFHRTVADCFAIENCLLGSAAAARAM